MSLSQPIRLHQYIVEPMDATGESWRILDTQTGNWAYFESLELAKIALFDHVANTRQIRNWRPPPTAFDPTLIQELGAMVEWFIIDYHEVISDDPLNINDEGRMGNWARADLHVLDHQLILHWGGQIYQLTLKLMGELR